MTEIEFMNENNLNECYQIHELCLPEHSIEHFKEFRTLEEAEIEGRKRMKENARILEIVIRRFFRKDGHIYYDGTKKWTLRRKDN